MMNFILDFNVISFGFFLLALIVICAYSDNFVRNPRIKQGLAYLELFSIFIFSLYVYFATTLTNYAHREILREEISKEYNVWISPTTTNKFGFLLCEKSDYQSQICKEYISYFIPKAVRYEQELQEKIAKEEEKEREKQKIEEEKEKGTQRLKEEEKMNIRSRIADIIEITGGKR